MEIIKNMNNISFTNQFIRDKESFYRLLHNDVKNIKKAKNNNKAKNNKESKIEYIESSNLLWFIFIMMHGFDEYSLIEKKIQLETKLRYNLIDTIKEKDNALLLKANKIKANEVINDLGNFKNIEMDTFKALCIILQKNYCIRNKKICEVNKYSDSTLFYIIEDNKMFFKQENGKDIEDTMYIVKSIKKPFKSVSSYKVAELKDICEKLDLLNLEDENKKLKKADYYAKLKEY